MTTPSINNSLHSIFRVLGMSVNILIGNGIPSLLDSLLELIHACRRVGVTGEGHKTRSVFCEDLVA